MRDTQAALDSTKGGDVDAGTRSRLSSLWERVEEPLLRALEARKEEVARSLERQLNEPRQQEQQALTTVIEDLRASIDMQLAALDEKGNYQLFLEGFGPSERDQREQAERDMEKLRRRLQELPGELVLEREAIARLMDRVGYDSFWMAEHHFQREGNECVGNLMML